MSEDRFKATTANPDEKKAIEELMKIMAQLEGKEIHDLYTPGSKLRVERQEGRYHAAIDVPIHEPSSDDEH